MKTKYSVLVLTALVIIALGVAAMVASSAKAANTTYYVDCSAGTNGSGTQVSPWNNLATVNGTTFGAGDQILFKRGTACTGTLIPRGSGSSGSPIIIDAYGAGNQPLIAGNGATNAVQLTNQEYWEIRNLEITNTAASPGGRHGVYITLSQGFGVGDYYRLINLTVHNVTGILDSRETGGIIFRVIGRRGATTLFNDILIEGNTVYSVDRTGIETTAYDSPGYCRPSVGCNGTTWVGWTNVVVRNNTVYDTGGDGIVVQNTINALVEHNVLHNANARSTSPNVALWAWDGDYTVFQYNEVYDTQGLADGMGMDIDYGQTGTTFQYNYSHGNNRGFLMFCGDGALPDTNVDGVVRYNISQNDRAENWSGIISVGGGVENAQIYNNTFYVGAGINADILNTFGWNGYPVDVHLYNNIFYMLNNPGPGGGWVLNPATTYDFQNNVFYGNHFASEPYDPYKITADPLLSNPGSGGVGLNSVNGYQLLAGSPAIGGGKLVANNGGKDYWGNLVSASSVPDIGAHQYSGAPAPTATAMSTNTPVATATSTNTPGGPTPTNTPLPSNLVQNSGFETGVLSPWTAWGSGRIGVGGHTGSYQAVMTSLDSGVQQIIPVSPNTTYVLTGWARGFKDTDTVIIGVKDYGGTELSQAVNSKTYQQKTVTFTTGASSITATIYCSKTGGNADGFCDDFSVLRQ